MYFLIKKNVSTFQLSTALRGEKDIIKKPGDGLVLIHDSISLNKTLCRMRHNNNKYLSNIEACSKYVVNDNIVVHLRYSSLFNTFNRK